MSKILWTTEKRNISELIPAKYNPRKSSDAEYKQLEKSLDKFSLADPLVINKNNTVIGGHFRLKILQAKGVQEIDVRIPSRLLDENEERELNLRLNKNLGLWDYDALADFDEDMLADVGFDSKELDKVFQLESSDADDAVPDARQETDIKLGDIFLLGEHRVMCGDSTKREDVEKLMQGKKADMVFTDPPYGVSYADKNKYLNSISPGNRIQTEIENDHKSEEEIQELWFKVFEIIRDNLSPIHSYYITGPQIQGMMMMMMMMMKAKLPYRHVLIWVKNNHVLGRCDYNYKHEPIFFGWTTKHKFIGGGQFKTSVWEIDKPHKSYLHPTMKPIELIENALLNSSERGDICLDLFLGSGSTLIACEKTSRVCYGMEIDPIYCQVIIDRWETFTGKKSEKIDG